QWGGTNIHTRPKNVDIGITGDSRLLPHSRRPPNEEPAAPPRQHHHGRDGEARGRQQLTQVSRWVARPRSQPAIEHTGALLGRGRLSCPYPSGRIHRPSRVSTAVTRRCTLASMLSPSFANSRCVCFSTAP